MTNSIVNLSFIIDQSLLALLVIRIVYSCINSKLKKSHHALLTFIFLSFVNSIIYLIQKDQINPNLSHASVPTFFNLLIFRPVKKIHFGIAIILSIVIFIVGNQYLISINYLLCILILTNQALVLSNRKSEAIKLSYVYLLMGLDQLITLVIFQMENLKTNWNDSFLLYYFSFIPLIIYPLGLFSIHANFRRLFLT